MDFQPIDYTSGNGFLQGLQGAGMYQQVQQQKAQAEQQKAQQQFQRDWQTAYASGDPAALDAIVAKYPQQMETVQKAIGFRDDNHRMALGNAARDLRIAAASGNPAAFAQAAAQHRATLQSVGSTPEDLFKQYQQDPRGTQHIIDTVGMGALGVKDYYAEQGNRETRAETSRSHRANEGLTARGQNLADARGWAGLNQAAQFHADDMQLKKLNYQQRQLENQYKAADNDLKRQAAQQKIDANDAAIAERQQQIKQGKDMSYEAAQLARTIASDPYLNVVTGSLQSRIPKFEGGSVDLINKAQQLQSMLTAGNLGLLKGSMSDKDLAFLKSMSSGLNVGDNGIRGSYSATKSRLEQIAGKLEAGLNGYKPEYAGNPPKPGGQQSAYSSLWGE
ncbi:DNA transfer protein [Erwinia tracheiphila]|uniref:DNA transfer protein n=1 Tax=Erwinia tracheiphila TaxID=65700 RepID=A0A345CT44_9GAMM|nr:phage DNA ejection protein [Erwinia tracheiphila]AXF76611.1 hypothetical protein AV903_12115 [Erwinia tracheiphila]UIA84717.1 DNA transfer protein [Erwinia tracheiphila]UIA93309.1 DNA transfer protein [Erwinia tracheiphila]